jgi:hypothetical protein
VRYRSILDHNQLNLELVLPSIKSRDTGFSPLSMYFSQTLRLVAQRSVRNPNRIHAALWVPFPLALSTLCGVILFAKASNRP